MKNISLFIAFIVLTGCFATMPDPVKDEFLVNQTSAQKQKLNDLADEIIAKRKEKEKIDDQLKITKQKIVITKKGIPVLEKENDMLIEKQKLYTLENNEEMLKKANDDLDKNQKALLQQKAYLKYLEALEDDQEALIELKHAGLAVKVAEMELEKARIARVYQETELGITDTPADNKDSKEQKTLINVSTYEEYYTKQKKLLDTKTEKQKKTAELLKQAKQELQNTGYTENI
ncbi:MAG TPA: hypothetical protein PK926_03485 [Spirochaetota bacterium]|nr:hypothetical protein [Spirochaetota bacterium]HPI88801.1 hypothetical protein [Spirochaetota bacterium]HPR47125.1 hypothetical protein [Spirochaetota bacterium]